MTGTSPEISTNTISTPLRVDLRSDTSSPPTAEMREAIARAVVGNDMFGEDPTANLLEERVARLLDKEAAVLMPTGVMANQTGVCVLTPEDGVMAVGQYSHIQVFESAVPRTLLSLDDSDDDTFFSQLQENVDRVSAIGVENSHMVREGHVSPISHLERIASLGRPVHLDGARLMNAAVALDVEPGALAAPATTVMFTLSKSLGAPLGSVLAGPADVIGRARMHRLAHGGGLAQAGIIGAAGLVALERSREELKADHQRAALIREVIAYRWPGSVAERSSPLTNIVMWTPPNLDTVAQQLNEHGVLITPFAPHFLRAVLHGGVTDRDVKHVLDVIRSI